MHRESTLVALLSFALIAAAAGGCKATPPGAGSGPAGVGGTGIPSRDASTAPPLDAIGVTEATTPGTPREWYERSLQAGGIDLPIVEHADLTLGEFHFFGVEQPIVGPGQSVYRAIASREGIVMQQPGLLRQLLHAAPTSPTRATCAARSSSRSAHPQLPTCMS